MAAYLSKCSVICSIAKTLLVYSTLTKTGIQTEVVLIVKKILDIMHC